MLPAGVYAQGNILHRDLTLREENAQLVSCGWPHDPQYSLVQCTKGKITISRCEYISKLFTFKFATVVFIFKKIIPLFWVISQKPPEPADLDSHQGRPHTCDGIH